MNRIGRDLALLARRLRQKPMFFVATLASLTVGLGIFAVVYTAAHKVLFEPLPFRDPDDLYMAWGHSPGLEHLMVSGPDVAALQAAGGVIEDAAAFQFATPTLPAADGRDTERIDAVTSSVNLFELLGVRPALGRVFRPEDGREGAPDEVVLSDRFWRRLGADPAIIGRPLTLSNTPLTVIGVLPPGVEFTGNLSRVRPDAYVAYEIDLGAQRPGVSNFRAVVRVRPGTTPEQARAAIGAVGSFVGRRDFNRNDRTLIAIGLHQELVEDYRAALLTLALTGTFLVIALAVNLASLLITRAADREREFAISRALGASGAAVVTPTLLEGAVLGLIGGAAGALAGIWGTRALVALAPLNLPRRDTIALDAENALVVVGLGMLLGLMAAALPAAWSARVATLSLTSGSIVRGGTSPGRMRRGLVVAQVALSLVLVATGALVARSFERLLAADPGFEPRGVLTFTLGISGAGLGREDADVYAFMDDVDAALRAVPGVVAVSATTQLPLSGGGNVAGVARQGSGAEPTIVSRIFTRAGYVDAMGLRLREGRDFDRSRRDGVREALIDRHLSRRLFPDGRAIGSTLASGDDRLTVVGVVDQPRLFDLHQDDETPQLFVRAEDFRGRRPASYVVRTTGDPHALIPHVRQVVRQLDRRVPVSSVVTMDDLVAARRGRERISTVLLAILAAGGLLLVAMGLFGVVAGAVARRRQELAVRLALGATYGRLLGRLIADGALLVLLGVLIGAPGVYAAGGMVGDLLAGVSPGDPPTLAVAAFALMVVATIACYLPARRVLQIDPAPLLRQQ